MELKIIAAENAEQFLKLAKPLNHKGGRKRQSSGRNSLETLDQIAAFDIETTRLKPEDFPELSAPEKIRGEWVETRRNEQSIMYIWTLCLHEKCMIIGRTWDEFTALIDGWNEYLIQNDYRLVIWVHNLSYEFQFLSGIHEFHRDEVMAVKSRKVLACTWGNIEFRCSYLHSNMNLDTFTNKMHAEHTKLSGKEFDYTKIRFPWTEMTQNELAYCTNDTQGLCEALANEMQADGDTLDTIPRTSTGYVRRDVRNAIRRNRELVYKIRAIFPDENVYTYLREAFRGGNTHANRHYAGKVLHNVISADRSSSYPDVQCNNLFPMGDFKKLGLSTVERLLSMQDRGTATLARIAISDCHLRHISDGCPYIPRDKCRQIVNGVYDNGRVIAADYLEITVTDIDLQIIVDHYTGTYTVIGGYYSTYGKLPPEMVGVLCDLYHKKTALKNVAGQELIYAKSKAKLNSVYGMTAQNPAKPEVYFDGEWGEDALNIGEALADAQRNAFLSYAWGVWTTAWARYHLQCGIDLVGTRFVYCDTDSVKYLETDVLPDWTPYNNDRIAASTKSGAWAVDLSGEAHYMGVFESDGKYPQFATLGAKKYAYTDENGKTHVTIAGVSKKEGGPELDAGDEYGTGLERFVNITPGFLFRKAGGAELMYNDHPAITSLSIDGHVLPITANVVIRDSTYQLGITAEYYKILQEITKEKH